jgi:UDP-3-O-[3-hydroxymyristoyl] N-acetylglucosamine deacetylase/3-hydroxyacyl-[acyl-carrier-protein] dehydratase
MMSDILQNQCTLKKEVTLNGVGLHTGKNVTLTFKPAPENTGYVFRRLDLEGEPCIAADANYVTIPNEVLILKKMV